MNGLGGLLLIAGLFVFGIIQTVIGYMGIEYHLGIIIAIICVLLAWVFDFTLPLTVGVFFGATDVLGWHWFWGLCMAAPLLMLMFSGGAMMVVGAAVERIKSGKTIW